jgi:hypothetical protein
MRFWRCAVGAVLFHFVGGMPATTSAGEAASLLTCDFRSRWRCGVPAFAEIGLDEGGSGTQVLFIGEMRPRGMLVLRYGGSAAGQGPEKEISLRSEKLDITSQLEIAGAYYSKEGSNEVKQVEAKELPVLKAYYDPDLPEKITLGPQNRSTVVLFEIGAGKPDEWAEGQWSVVMRFNAGRLPVRLQPAMGASMAPRREDAVVWELKFEGRKPRTEGDRIDLLYFHYREAKALVWQYGGYKPAIDALSAIIEARPDEVNLRVERAQMLAWTGREEEAVKEVGSIIDLARTGNLKKRIRVPLSPRSTEKEAIAWLEKQAVFWKASLDGRRPRIEAMQSLLDADAGKALRELEVLLRPEEDYVVKVEAVRLLGGLGDKRAGPFLVGVMSEKWFYGTLRPQAHKALCKLYPEVQPDFGEDGIRDNYGAVVAFWRNKVVPPPDSTEAGH